MESHSICDTPAKRSTQMYDHDLKVKVRGHWQNAWVSNTVHQQALELF